MSRTFSGTGGTDVRQARSTEGGDDVKAELEETAASGAGIGDDDVVAVLGEGGDVA